MRKIAATLLWVGCVLAACGGRTRLDHGGETHWLSSCQESSSCGDGFDCICGRCTLSCSSDATCKQGSDEAVCASSDLVKFAADCETAPPRICVRERDVVEPEPPRLEGWADVDPGDAHTCALTLNGELYCWGDGSFGQLGVGNLESQTTPTRVGVDEDWLALATGGTHSCALKKDGSLYCWGTPLGGDSNDVASRLLTPSRVGDDDQWTQLTTGGSHACAINAGALYCWGRNIFGMVGDGTTDDRSSPTRIGTNQWKQVSAGVIHTCAIDEEAALYCWGYSFEGRLGIGDVEGNALTPTRVGEDNDWQSVSAGYAHTCGRKLDGSVYCWGGNLDSTLGTGRDEWASETPFLVPGTRGWSSVAAGGYRTCGLDEEGSLLCWGASDDALRNDPNVVRTKPEKFGDEGAWSVIAQGYNHTCGITADHALFCWGANELGQVGDGTRGRKFTPSSPVALDGEWRSVALGENHTCGVTTENELYCWGSNGRGELGTGTGLSSRVPERVDDATDWQDVWASGEQACATKLDGSLHCWGDSRTVNENANEFTATPVRVATESGFSSLSFGYSHVCATKTAGSLYCWGYASGGALADAFTEQNDVVDIAKHPTRVGVDEDWTVVSLPATRSFALKADGTLHQWGYDFGDEETANPQVRQVGTAQDWTHISAGPGHLCGLRNGGQLYCWGGNDYGQLGTGTTTPLNEPERARDARRWMDVSSGAGHTCAIDEAGGLYCWGDVNSENIVSGENYLLEPTRVGNETTWRRVFAGRSHTCAQKVEGTLHCWGSSDRGELGDGDGWRREPTKVTHPTRD